MRASLAIAAWAFVLASSPLAVEAQSGRPESKARAGDGNSSVIISNPGARSPGGSSAGGGAGIRRTGARSGPRYTERTTRVVERPGVGACVETVTRARDTAPTPADAGSSAMAGGVVGGLGLPACPPSAGVATTPTPEMVAEPFVRTVRLPVPQPHIAPDGTNITGLPAYLETNGTLAHEVGPTPTDLGPITVAATSAYWVDWGDGSAEDGPYTVEGEPYPTGRIFHVYRFTGSYTVTVRQAWSATWRLGGDSGTVEGLRTQASVPLEVNELQAVIVR